MTASVSEAAGGERVGASRAARRARLRLTEALARGDLDAADQAAAELAHPHPPSLFEPMGMLHLARGRFAEASTALARVPRPEARIAVLRQYAANMHALQTHRPEVARLIAQAPTLRHYEIDGSRGPLPTIVRMDDPAAEPAPVTPGGDAIGHLQRIWARQAPAAAQGKAMTVLGVGDGHLLRKLAEQPPKTLTGNDQVIVIVEPDVDLLRACLMLHDLSVAIAQVRFTWCVGDGWADALQARLDAEPQLPLPADVVRLMSPADPAGPRYLKLLRAYHQADAEVAETVQRHYAERSASDPARALSGKAGRPPRALLLTSRFTTVLQYSTRDTAEALEALGWQTRVLIEQAPHLQMTVRHVRQALAEFKPDLVFMIDHLRRETDDLFPPQLPFVCWIQDELPSLTCREAGESITARDFILTAGPHGCARDFGYPLRQSVFLEKATRIPERPATWTSDGDDLVFVSNASQQPAAVANELKQSLSGQPALARWVERVCDRMLAIYEAGGAIHVPPQLRCLLDEAARETGASPSPDAIHSFTTQIFNRLNNPLYRQQALRWAASAAQRLGLTLALYGSGWEDHPEFAAYARGPVGYGRDLENLTRRARINLQIVPFGCLHQRLLDGIAAGGFFLIRTHPIDALIADIHTFCSTRLRPDINTLAAAQQHLDRAGNVQLDALLDRYAAVTALPRDLMIPQYWHRIGNGIEYVMRGLPLRSEVAFDDEAGLTAAIERYLRDPGRRGQVWREQLGYVENHLTYASQMRRVLGWMAKRLEEEQAGEAPPEPPMAAGSAGASPSRRASPSSGGGAA